MPISADEKVTRMRSIENGKGLDYILSEGYKILGNPIVMYDTSYNLLAHVDGIVTDDELWNELVSNGTFSHESVDFFNAAGFIEAYAQSDIVTFLRSSKLKYDRMNAKLFDKDGVQLGDIIVLLCQQPLEDGDAELIEILSETLSLELQNSELYQRIDRVYQETILNKLIEGKVGDGEIGKGAVDQLHSEFDGHLFLAVIDITQYDHTVTHLAYFRDLFKKMQPEHRYHIHLNNIVAIMKSESAFLRVERSLGKLDEFFGKYNIYAGISSGFSDLMELKKQHREAICALNYGLVGMRQQQIFRFDDIRLEHFLDCIRTTIDISEIISPVVHSIIEYDMARKTKLIKLLYTYLLYGKDAALASEALRMSGCEFDNHVRLLSENFGIDWQNGDMLFNIYASLKLSGGLSS